MRIGSSRWAPALDNRGRPSGPSLSSEVVDHALSRVRRGNPLLRPADAFPFRIEVWSIETRDDREEIKPETPRRRCEYRPMSPDQHDEAGILRRHLLAAGQSGKRFEIRVWNNGSERVAMTLLVDGVNTLGQTCEPPGRSWSWVLDPTKDPTRPSIFAGPISPPSRPPTTSRGGSRARDRTRSSSRSRPSPPRPYGGSENRQASSRPSFTRRSGVRPS